MINFNFRRLLMILGAVALSINAFAKWGILKPIIQHDIPKSWDYQTENYMKGLPDKTPLNKIAMVSCHDAGMNEDTYPYPTCSCATQYNTIYEQLMNGVRFFDIRVTMHKGVYRAYHGLEYGMALDSMLDDAVKFLNETQKDHEHNKETVIFELSHWCSEAEMKTVLEHILSNSSWSNMLFKDTSGSPRPQVLNEVHLSQLRGKLLIIVDAPNPASEETENALDHKMARLWDLTPAKGIWRFGALASGSKGKYGYYRIYDSYSDSDSFDHMIQDQKNKFHNFELNYSKNIDSFLYCYQLTFQAKHFWRVSIGKFFAEKINPQLDREFNSLVNGEEGAYPNLVNLDYVDGRICNIVINKNLALLDQKAIPYLNPVFNKQDYTTHEEYLYCKSYTELEGTFNDRYKFQNGWYVIKGTVDMKKGADVEGDNVNIILKDGCCLTVTGDGVPGIRTENSSSAIHIYAQSSNEATMGKLVASASKYNAAIGGRQNCNGENIHIHGGKIEANGGEGAAAIGGGYAGCGNKIYIYGGVVTAKSSKDGAAIGGGTYYRGGADGTNINIYAGKVEADASKDSTKAAGIGGGWGGSGSHISIYGGYVHAIGTISGAGIGGGAHWGGSSGTGEYINIHGGEIHAEGGSAIGGGENADGKHIEISGGKVYATALGKSFAAAIGGGHGGSADYIQIKGGYIEAKGSESGAGIGGGCYMNGGGKGNNINISGGTIDITGIHNAHSIGSANDASGNGVTIRGGSIWGLDGKGIEKPHDNTNIQLFGVTVPECGETGTPVVLNGLPSSYEFTDVTSKYNAVKIWLPNGTHNFHSEQFKYSVTVSNNHTTAEVKSRSIPVIVGPSGYTTLYSDKKLNIPEKVRVFAYMIKSETNELIPVPINKEAVLPADQGYVVKAMEGIYYFMETNDAASTIESVLVGTHSDVPKSNFHPDKKKYGLGRINGKTAFYEYKSDTIRCGKAYYIK